MCQRAEELCPCAVAKREKTFILHSFPHSFKVPSLSTAGDLALPLPSGQLQYTSMGEGDQAAQRGPLTQLLGWSGQAFGWRRHPTVS